VDSIAAHHARCVDRIRSGAKKLGLIEKTVNGKLDLQPKRVCSRFATERIQLGLVAPAAVWFKATQSECRRDESAL
jgi:hypothetical protein